MFYILKTQWPRTNLKLKKKFTELSKFPFCKQTLGRFAGMGNILNTWEDVIKNLKCD